MEIYKQESKAANRRNAIGRNVKGMDDPKGSVMKADAATTHRVTLVERFTELLQCVEVLEIVLGFIGSISDLTVKGPPCLHVHQNTNTSCE